MKNKFFYILFALLLTVSSLAHAEVRSMISSGVSSGVMSPVTDGTGGVPVAPPAFLDTIVSNMELELDATEITSYPGSGQTWFNLTSSPDSGALKAENNFFLGADGSVSTDDPTFNVDRFDLDGGDIFTSVTNSGGGTAWMDTIGESTQPVTFIMVIDTPSTLVSNKMFFSSGLVGSGDTAAVIRMENSGGEYRFFQRSGGTTLNMTMAISMSPSQNDCIFIVSVDFAAAKVEVWYRSNTPVIATSVSFDTTNTGTNSSPTNIAGHNNGAQLPNGSAYKYFAIRNLATNDTEAEAIIVSLKTRGLISQP